VDQFATQVSDHFRIADDPGAIKKVFVSWFEFVLS